MPHDLTTKIHAAAGAGFTSLELRTPELPDYLQSHTLDELRELLRSHDARVESINALAFVTFRGDDYGRVQEECEELCSWAAALDCPIVLAVPSPTPSHSTSWDEIKTESARVLDDLASIGAPHGVTIAFEPLGFAWCSVRSVAAASEILDQCVAQNVALVVDFFHFYLAGSRLQDLEGLDLARVPIVHVDDVADGVPEAITDADRVFPGEGAIPIEAICGRLAALGFSGLLSVELFRPEYWAQSAEEVSRRAYESVAAVAERYFAAN